MFFQKCHKILLDGNYLRCYIAIVHVTKISDSILKGGNWHEGHKYSEQTEYQDITSGIGFLTIIF